MWLLEHEGDLFQQKKIWLRPGRTYLFGRTPSRSNPGEQCYAISDKSVSRKHLIVSVAPVKPGDSGNVYAKSNLTISDESKVGTYLDGTKFIKESRTLTKFKHTIKLGNYQHIFRVSWNPVVLTFSFTEKQQKNTEDPLNRIRAKLEPLDIKTVHPYLTAETSHVVASKRNIAKGLQALINGKHIVTEDFVDSIIAAATSPGTAEDGSPLPSPLEGDYAAHWPDALRFLPEPGKEPNPRPANMFAPDPDRIRVFEGYTFVFADTTQYEQLHAVITNGSAKAVKYDMKLGQTTVQEFAAFVRSVADDKGLTGLAELDRGEAVIVVRFRGKGDTAQWVLDFLHNLDKALGQRSIEQNQFLDAILLNNGRILYEPLHEEAPGSTAVSAYDAEPSNVPQVTSSRAAEKSRAPESSQRVQSSMPEERKPEEPSPVKARVRRELTKSRFKGFDDDFDASRLPKSRRKAAASSEDEDETRQPDSRARPETADSIEIDSAGHVGNSQRLAVRQTRSTVPQKRPTPAPDNDEDSDGVDAFTKMTDALLPTSMAMKRRRMEEERAGIHRPEASKIPDTDQNPTRKASDQKKQPAKQVDIRSAAKSRAQLLDEQKRKELGVTHADNDDDNHNAYGDEDLSALGNLAIVQEMDIAPRPDRIIRGSLSRVGEETAVDCERWDERWNGRRNFKKFRKQVRPSEREEDISQHRTSRTIVGIEPANPRRSFAQSEPYWLTTSNSGSTTRATRGEGGSREAQSQNQATTQTETTTEFDNGEEKSQGLFVSQGDEERPRTRQSTRDQTDETSPERFKRKGKRPASSSGETAAQMAPPPKKTKAAPARQTRLRATRADDSDEDDGLKFRRKR